MARPAKRYPRSTGLRWNWHRVERAIPRRHTRAKQLPPKAKKTAKKSNWKRRRPKPKRCSKPKPAATARSMPALKFALHRRPPVTRSARRVPHGSAAVNVEGVAAAAAEAAVVFAGANQHRFP